MLAEDYTVSCSTPTHVAFQLVAGAVIVLFAFGVPIGFCTTLVLKSKSLDTKNITSQAVAVAAEIGVDQQDANDVIRELSLGGEYGFLLKAYSSRNYFFESIDMLRKLIVVGILVVVDRGSVAQVTCAAMLSFAFSMLQFKIWPYKMTVDNRFKAAVEAQIFFTILIALLLKCNLDEEMVGEGFYDAVVVTMFMVNVPIAFVCTCVAKLNHGKELLARRKDGDGGFKGDRLPLDQPSNDLHRVSTAFYLHKAGLASSKESATIRCYLAQVAIRMEAERLESLAAVIEGRGMITTLSVPDPGPPPPPAATMPFRWRPSENVDHPRPFHMQISAPKVPREDDSPVADARDANDPFSKFTGGFDGTFADTSTFFGGLGHLIGEPRKDVARAVEEEHCNVSAGFGASDSELETGNYHVTFTPRKEYMFVADPSFSEPMDAGVDNETHVRIGFRERICIKTLRHDAVQLINEAFDQMGWGAATVNQASFDRLIFQQIELVCLRLYTGPMFMLYNTVLRSMNSGGVVPFGSLKGLHVEGRFVTTIHATNSGVIKLSRLQPACPIFRGVSGMKLPRSFTVPNAQHIMSGVELGFMSASLDRNVAEKYSKGSTDAPSLIFEMQQGMVNRGAFLGWLSQYPHEKGACFLLPFCVVPGVCSCSLSVCYAVPSLWLTVCAYVFTCASCVPCWVFPCRRQKSWCRRSVGWRC
eukprot:SAG22_NODE_510_length_9598_cov_6.080114_4_plen_700_part_00